LAAGGPRAVGYLPQSPAFRPRFTVGETLEFYGDLLTGEVDVDVALERVGMAGAADRRTEALSGGMRRLLGIAQATLGDPPLLLLDEPTSDLDPRMTEHIFGVIEGHIVVSGAPGELRGDADSALDALFAEYVADPTAALTVGTHEAVDDDGGGES
jgi:ABC-type multidrug transport system ATPase subunit